MSLKEEYLYWFFINQLIKQYGYRFVSASDDQTEIWLASDSNTDSDIIRLKLGDLGWANNLKKDQHMAIHNGEKVRRFLGKKAVTVKTVYISTYAPVDDYSEIVRGYEEPEFRRVHAESLVFQTSAIEESLEELRHFLPYPLEGVNRQSEEIEESEIEELKQSALTASYQKVKKDEAVFQKGKPILTYLLMAIQVIVFFILEMKGGSTNTQTLIEFGAKYNPLIMTGEWWRFFTPIFLHIGFTHLALNTLSLYFVGIIVERIYGSARFFMIYFFAGFAGTLLSFLLVPNISAGASGAIFGLLGALLFFGIVYPNLFFRTMGWNVIIILLINLVITFSASAIDSAGHIGGLVGGFLAAAIVGLPNKGKPVWQIVSFLGTALLTAGLLFYGFTAGANGTYEMDMGLAQEYISQEDDEKAYETVQKYLDGDNYPEAYFFAGYLEFRNGDLDKAEEHFLTAIEQRPDFPEAYYDLGLIYWQRQDLDLAREYIEKALEQDPDNKDFQEVLERIKQSQSS